MRTLITKENHLGKINISAEYTTDMIKDTVSECFGIAGLVSVGMRETIASGIGGKSENYGISVKVCENRVTINLHISVTFGTNIPAVVYSLRSKLRFVLSESMGIEPERVNIYVDEIVS